MAATPVVIDACSSLNLFASGCPVDIVRAADVHLLVLPEVESEAQYLLGEPDDEGNRPPEPIDWKVLMSAGLATSQPLPDDALPVFIELAAHLTDVDAKCVALAKQLKVGLVSDDGKVRRVYSATGGVQLRSTVSLVRKAATVLPLDKAMIRTLFARIRERARFEPPRKDPDHGWYLDQLKA